MSARVFGYGRVSTPEQSNANQRVELEAAGFKIEPHRWFVDVVSGKTPAMQRSAFTQLVHRLEATDVLVVAKLDRLGRDSVDVESTLRQLEGMKVGVIVVQLGKTDLTSTAGRVFRKILAAIAEMERDLLIERVQAGLARARAQGKALGRPSKTTPTQQETIRQRAAAGASISALAREFGISRSSTRDVLRREAA